MLYEKIREMNELGKLEVFNNYLLHIGKDIIYAKSKSTFENNGWYCVLDADGFEKYLVYHYDTGKKICVRFVDGKTPQIQEADPALPWFGEIIDVFSVLSFASDSQGNVIDIVQNALDDEAIKVNHLNTEEGDAVKLVGYDSEGNLVEDSIPEGITTDSALNKESDNAIENAPVATALEDITADIYDATADYAVGDYCLHEWKLYKCNTAITGGEEWTSDHWTLVNVSGELKLKADISALENGTLVVSKALTAEEIAPVSEESGTIQDDPFISQGTGTENNTGSTDTSPVGKQLEKQGNTLAVNQLAPSNTIASNTSNGITCRQNGDGTYTLSGTAEAEANFVGTQLTLPVGHKLLISGGKSESVVVGITNHGNTSGSRIFTITQNGSLYISVANGTDLTTPITLFPIIADLTQDFNGDIPQDLLDHPDHFSWYYNGSLAHNAGTLKNADGRYLVCTKRQLWDEVAEIGSISTSTGENTVDTNCIRSKNHIRVVPNKPLYWFNGSTYKTGVLFFYDKDKAYLGTATIYNNGIINVPSNAIYLRFRLVYDYGTTYNNDITISLYYTPEQGGEGYDQYYPYQEPKVYDTGSEVLRSAGSVRDVKLPDGTIHRLVKNWTFALLSCERIERGSSGEYYFAIGNSNIKDYIKPLTQNAILDYGLTLLTGQTFTATVDRTGYIGADGTLYVYFEATKTMTVADFVSWINGKVINFELATPTTEQGTTFSENIEIDDYGMMYWLDTDGNLVDVPQGVKLFYPAWYVGFIDTLYARTSGDATSVVVQSELTAVDNKIGAKLPECPIDTDGTYVLKAVVADGEVTYTWVAEEA